MFVGLWAFEFEPILLWKLLMTVESHTQIHMCICHYSDAIYLKFQLTEYLTHLGISWDLFMLGGWQQGYEGGKSKTPVLGMSCSKGNPSTSCRESPRPGPFILVQISRTLWPRPKSGVDPPPISCLTRVGFNSLKARKTKIKDAHTAFHRSGRLIELYVESWRGPLILYYQA